MTSMRMVPFWLLSQCDLTFLGAVSLLLYFPLLRFFYFCLTEPLQISFFISLETVLVSVPDVRSRLILESE